MAAVRRGSGNMTKKLRISGPGAADFLTSEGGIDQPETDPAKGMAQTRDEGVINDATTLEPDLDAPDPAVTRERGVTPPGRDERRSE
jgi:hypothetical protein